MVPNRMRMKNPGTGPIRESNATTILEYGRKRDIPAALISHSWPAVGFPRPAISTPEIGVSMDSFSGSP